LGSTAGTFSNVGDVSTFGGDTAGTFGGTSDVGTFGGGTDIASSDVPISGAPIDASTPIQPMTESGMLSPNATVQGAFSDVTPTATGATPVSTVPAQMTPSGVIDTGGATAGTGGLGTVQTTAIPAGEPATAAAGTDLSAPVGGSNFVSATPGGLDTNLTATQGIPSTVAPVSSSADLAAPAATETAATTAPATVATAAPATAATAAPATAAPATTAAAGGGFLPAGVRDALSVAGLGMAGVNLANALSQPAPAGQGYPAIYPGGVMAPQYAGAGEAAYTGGYTTPQQPSQSQANLVRLNDALVSGQGDPLALQNRGMLTPQQAQSLSGSYNGLVNAYAQEHNMSPQSLSPMVKNILANEALSQSGVTTGPAGAGYG
jgi:hypothetical protein